MPRRDNLNLSKLETLRRLLGPVCVVMLIATLWWSTIWNGWMEPLKGMSHGRIELTVYVLEMFWLVLCYASTIWMGPGFVPAGWAPSLDDADKYFDVGESSRPLMAPVHTACLQFCEQCKCYKPPRAHHCSVCQRCVTWMDHHCPWTSTCVGHKNKKAYTLFIHSVVCACAHIVAIHTEVLFRMGTQVRRRGSWKIAWLVLFNDRTLVCIACLLMAMTVLVWVHILVWQNNRNLCTGMTRIERSILGRAQKRRRKTLESPFVFPYDLGHAYANWCEVLGPRWLLWALPTRTGGDAFWPTLKEGRSHAELVMEQVAQKIVFDTSTYMVIVQPFFGCFMAWLSLPPLHEPRLAVREGDRVVVTRQRDHWVFGCVVKDSNLGCAESADFGWFPRACTKKATRRLKKVPCQNLLQGIWSVHAGLCVRVVGVIVYVIGNESDAPNPPFVFRCVEPKGLPKTTELQGCSLLECDGKVARWSNGGIWNRTDYARWLRSSTPSAETIGFADRRGEGHLEYEWSKNAVHHDAETDDSNDASSEETDKSNAGETEYAVEEDEVDEEELTSEEDESMKHPSDEEGCMSRQHVSMPSVAREPKKIV